MSYKKRIKVPVYSKQELLTYILAQESKISIKIVTNSGQIHYGAVLNMGHVTDEGDVILLEHISDERQQQGSIIHIATDKVESIELLGSENVIGILSKGEFSKYKTYDISGTLEAKRTLQAFSKTIFDIYAIPIVVSEMNLPTDGQELNRVIQLIELIQHAMIILLKEEHAHESFKNNYTTISFLYSDRLTVLKNGTTLSIHFPFHNIEFPEFSMEKIISEILKVL